MIRFEDISYNFSVAKVLAILMVATGHYFGGVLWVPTTIALFVFAFSSGFFTSQKYGGEFSKGKFWSAKIQRLVCRILVIDVFLFVVFLVRHKAGIFTWQTLPALVGLNGFLVWFNIENATPFGAGLWFFTLLLIFYFVYPFLVIVNRQYLSAIIALVLSLVVTTILYYLVPMGHMLWMTVFAFLFGDFSGKYGFNVRPNYAACGLIVSVGAMLYLNYALAYNMLNYQIILLASVCVVGYLLNKRLPSWGMDKVLLLSGCVLEIYFIHGYMYVKTISKHDFLNYVVSIIVIIVIGYLLSEIAEKIEYKMRNKVWQRA